MADDIQVEWIVKIEHYKNGTTTVIAPEMEARKVRGILMDAFMSVNEDICVNKSLGLLNDYMTNMAEQSKILHSANDPRFMRKPS